MFERVDLPAPFSPSRACTSPSAASKSTRSLARTPGNRFVMPVSETAAAIARGLRRGAGAPPHVTLLALRAPDDALDEPVHRVQLLDRHALALRHAELAALVAGLSTFCPRTSAPAACRFWAALVSFSGENHEFVQISLTLTPGCVACAPSAKALACRSTSGIANGTT